MPNTIFQVRKEELEIRMERIFHASREKIWAAYTDASLIPKWWGPRALTTIVESMEVKPSGTWRFIHRDHAGKEYAFNGEFLEIDPPSRIMQTFIYEGYPDNVMVETVVLEEISDTETKAVSISEFPSIEALEGMVSSGMEQGARESWERLAELVESA